MAVRWSDQRFRSHGQDDEDLIEAIHLRLMESNKHAHWRVQKDLAGGAGSVPSHVCYCPSTAILSIRHVGSTHYGHMLAV